MSYYHLFKRTVKSKKGKPAKKWYYWWLDPVSKIRIQKVCKGAKNQEETFAYISQLPPPVAVRKTKIKDICKDMFVPDSEHMYRLSQLGKKLGDRTLQNYNRFKKIIIDEFGEMYLEDLTVQIVHGFLLQQKDKSASWKNSILETLNYVYEECPWKTNVTVPKPSFPRFVRNSKKADIFTTEELNRFFDGINWEEGLRDYLLFLVTVSCGLRIGEARGLKVKQIIPENNALVIDGFCLKDGTRTNYNKKGSDENKKLRVTLIPDETLKMLLNYIANYNLSEDDFIFQRDDGSPVRQEYLEAVFKRVLIRAGIDKRGRKLCPHSFRYTYVTKMRSMVGGETVQKLVGHTSIEMTEYYTRVSIPDMIKSLQIAVPAVNKLFE